MDPFFGPIIPPIAPFGKYNFLNFPVVIPPNSHCGSCPADGLAGGDCERGSPPSIAEGGDPSPPTSRRPSQSWTQIGARGWVNNCQRSTDGHRCLEWLEGWPRTERNEQQVEVATAVCDRWRQKPWRSTRRSHDRCDIDIGLAVNAFWLKMKLILE